MSNLNNLVLLKGNVGNDPEVTYHDNGNVVANFSMATTDSWKDKSGQWQEKIDWITLTCFGELAKKLENNVVKGTKLLVQGKLVTDSWVDKDNPSKKHYKTYVHVKEFQVISKGKTNNSTDDLNYI
jgi:single-strand DNA-binding protein